MAGRARDEEVVRVARIVRADPAGIPLGRYADVLPMVSQIGERSRGVHGDPVEWLLAHAGTVRLVLDLAHGLQLGDARVLARSLDPHRVRREDGLDIEVRTAHPNDAVPGVRWFPTQFGRPNDVKAVARNIIAELVNGNLRARRRLLRDDLRPYFTLQALVDHVYWHLADQIGGGQLRRCPECGSIFTATDDRMEYCPPPMGVDGPSRCMNRAKVARWRRKLRKKIKARRPRR